MTWQLLTAVLAPVISALLTALALLLVTRMRRPLDNSQASLNDAQRARIQIEIVEGVNEELRKQVAYYREEINGWSDIQAKTARVTAKLAQVARRDLAADTASADSAEGAKNV